MGQSISLSTLLSFIFPRTYEGQPEARRGTPLASDLAEFKRSSDNAFESTRVHSSGHRLYRSSGWRRLPGISSEYGSCAGVRTNSPSGDDLRRPFATGHS